MRTSRNPHSGSSSCHSSRAASMQAAQGHSMPETPGCLGLFELSSRRASSWVALGSGGRRKRDGARSALRNTCATAPAQRRVHACLFVRAESDSAGRAHLNAPPAADARLSIHPRLHRGNSGLRRRRPGCCPGRHESLHWRWAHPSAPPLHSAPSTAPHDTGAWSARRLRAGAEWGPVLRIRSARASRSAMRSSASE